MIALLLHSCITDEFRVKDLAIDPDWEIGVVSPIFSGKLEFRDFVHDWKTPVPDLPGQKVVLDYDDTTDILIPAEIIFDESPVIDSFPFYIQGSYEFVSVDLLFTVENGSPFPLNLEMYFYEKREWFNFGPPINPQPFQEANFVIFPVVPVKSTHKVTLSTAQLAYFIRGNRMRLVSWYDKNEFLVLNNTISAHYPVNVSITLVGKVKAKQND